MRSIATSRLAWHTSATFWSPTVLATAEVLQEMESPYELSERLYPAGMRLKLSGQGAVHFCFLLDGSTTWHPLPEYTGFTWSVNSANIME